MVESQGLATLAGDVGGASDQELVDQARAGRHEARETLARRHRQAAYLLALQMLGNRDDAMDVAQDAMLRFFTSLDSFDPASGLAKRARHSRASWWTRRRPRKRTGGVPNCVIESMMKRTGDTSRPAALSRRPRHGTSVWACRWAAFLGVKSICQAGRDDRNVVGMATDRDIVVGPVDQQGLPRRECEGW